MDIDPLNVTAMACPAFPLCPLAITEVERRIPDILKWVHVVFEKIWLGGTPNQTSLAKCFMNNVKVQELEKVLEPLFYYWKRKQQSKESFSSFTKRMISETPLTNGHPFLFLTWQPKTLKEYKKPSWPSY
ncbi:hypothetical protein LOK49_LG01G01313 [Camellia lanceoleosa]|uniref:Uncharacterized protein n=1 Tax=Camellia lanceoleosa TaxID=1840588 RepID=A0ACC0J353_9ERIC|nr:hypothetical protein LOK49_LG01G01313 [Camellia lanceoleosa]